MRILLTCDVIEGAGITTYCENLAEGLNEIGHEVILLAGSTSHHPSKYYKPPKTFKNCVFINEGHINSEISFKKVH